MRYQSALTPGPEDKPFVRLGGIEGRIPVLYLDGEYGEQRIQFAEADEQTVLYLDHLIAAATELRLRITERMRS